MAGPFALATRYRRGSDIERQQLKWFVWAVSLVLAGGLLDVAVAGIWSGAPPAVADLAWLVFAAAAITVPVAAVVAILRYRLYDIDRLIGRTFVYGALTAILAGLYAASIRLFTSITVSVTGQSSDIVLVLTTLVLATTFTPIKQRLETVAGQRFKSPSVVTAGDPRAAPSAAGDPPVATASATANAATPAAISGAIATSSPTAALSPDLDRRIEEIAERVARAVLAERDKPAIEPADTSAPSEA